MSCQLWTEFSKTGSYTRHRDQDRENE